MSQDVSLSVRLFGLFRGIVTKTIDFFVEFLFDTCKNEPSGFGNSIVLATLMKWQRKKLVPTYVRSVSQASAFLLWCALGVLYLGAAFRVTKSPVCIAWEALAVMLDLEIVGGCSTWFPLATLSHRSWGSPLLGDSLLSILSAIFVVIELQL